MLNGEANVDVHGARGTLMGVRRPEWVLAAAVLVSSPMIPGILNGGIDVSSVLLRFLGALLLCWGAGWVLTLVIDRYSESARRAEIVATIEAAIQRRADANAAAASAPPDRLAGPGGSGASPGGAGGPAGPSGGALGPGHTG